MRGWGWVYINPSLPRLVAIPSGGGAAAIREVPASSPPFSSISDQGKEEFFPDLGVCSWWSLLHARFGACIEGFHGEILSAWSS